MKPIIPIEVVWICTTIDDGKEVIIVDSHGTPFVYTSITLKILMESGVLEQLQKWANASGRSFALKKFTCQVTLDEIVPMKTELTM